MTNTIDPDRERFAQFQELPRDGVIQMLNLIRLKKEAVYEDGTKATGEEAYKAYSRESGPIFQSVGGKIIWSGAFELTLIGPETEQWDLCFIAEYPSADAFLEMVRNEEYQKAVRHRTAAVETSRLIRTRPRKEGSIFG